MPVMFDLHRARASEGLAVIGVHDDSVRVPKVLLRRTQHNQRRLWNDRDPPFPTAIDSGAKDGPYAAYGMLDVPTAVVIDRGGKVLASFADVNDPAFRATVDAVLSSNP
jgi:hypothetical protein